MRNNTSPEIDRILVGIGAARPPVGMTTKVIAIDGPGGAGKSTLAERLSDALGNTPILHTDDFASWDNPVDWWPRVITEVLEPLSVNQSGRYQRYDWPSRATAEWHDVPPAPYVILEGVSASREAFRPYLCYTIWVETPREERLRRGLERDGMDARELWEGWMAEEDAYIEREHPVRRADIVVTGTGPY